MNILVGACLLGLECRYNGKGELHSAVEKLLGKHNLIPFCPEIYGGLKTPRDPAEILGARVITKNGEDVTENYEKGADEALKMCKLLKVDLAILKERSPSCGLYEIHDGNFGDGMVEGKGICGKRLAENGIKAIGESRVEEFFKDFGGKV